MIKKWQVTYPCFSGAEKRRVYLYLPKNYHHHTERKYPVLYMFDGQNVFFDDNATYGKSWGLGKFLNKIKAPLIVVAVECNAHADNGRLSEYSPFFFNSNEIGGPFPARGEETLLWYENNLKPFIDKNFRTLPQRETTFIAGSSMGGLMSLYALLAHNNTFSRACALSPSFDVDIAALKELIKNSKPAQDTVLYMDYGSQEFSYEPEARGHFTEVSKLLLEKNIHLTSRIVPKGEHNEASWEKQLPFAINTLLYEVNKG